MPPGLTPIVNQVAQSDSEATREVRIVGLLAVLIKRWRVVLGMPVVVAFAVAAAQFLLPSRFLATTSFIPESSDPSGQLPGALAGLASQFGVNIPASGNTPDFYADVLRSRALLDRVLQAEFLDPQTSDPNDRSRLLEILDIDGKSDAEIREKGERRLRRMVTVSVSRTTGIVELTVETPDRVLSASVANRFVDFLNEFNLRTRQSNARALREFVEARVVDAETELRSAEEELKNFLEGNRFFGQSPELQFEHERLQRRVRIKEQVLTTLNTQYETARIQEVNDTPLLTVLDAAAVPHEKSRPRRRVNVMLAFFAAGMLGLVVAVVREYVEQARRVDDGDFRQLAGQWGRTRTEWRDLLGFRGGRGRG